MRNGQVFQARPSLRCPVDLPGCNQLTLSTAMMKVKKTAAGLSPAAAQVSGESRRAGLPADPRDQNGILAAGRNYSDDVGLVTAYEFTIWVALGKPTASGATVFQV
ncbi:hypothetical protein ACVIWU_006800 [Bradyrhizobium sp. USDA 4509]